MSKSTSIQSVEYVTHPATHQFSPLTSLFLVKSAVPEMQIFRVPVLGIMEMLAQDDMQAIDPAFEVLNVHVEGASFGSESSFKTCHRAQYLRQPLRPGENSIFVGWNR